MTNKNKKVNPWESAIVRFFDSVVIPKPVVFSIICLAIASMIGFGLKFLSFNTDYRMYFEKNNPQLMSYQYLQQVFAKDDSIILAVKPSSGSVFNKQSLKLIYEITEMSWLLPHSLRVDSLTNFAHSRADEDSLTVADLVENPELLDNDSIKKIQAVAMSDELVTRKLVSSDETLALVKITFALEELNPQVVDEIVSVLNKNLDKFRVDYPGQDIAATGNVLAGATFAEAAIRDLKTLIPLMYLIIAVILVLTLKSAIDTGLVVLTVALSTIVCMGSMGWIGYDLSTSTAIAPTIVMTLAIADVIHLLGSFHRYYNQLGERSGAIRKALAENFLPIFLTSFTTAIGFLSMNFNKVPPFRELGNIVAIGVTGAFIIVITIVPALLLVLPAKEMKSASNKSFSKLPNFIIKYRNAILGTFALVTILAGSGVALLEVNDSVTKYFDHSFDFRVHSDIINKSVGGLDTIEYTLNSDGPEGITDTNYLKWVSKFAEEAEKIPSAAHVSSIASVFKKINKNMNGDDPKYLTLPDSNELAAQYLLLYEMSLPSGRDLSNVVSVDKSSTRVSIVLKEVSTQEVRTITDHLDRWLADNPYKNIKNEQQGTGLTVVFANIYLENIWGMIFGTASAVILITITMIIALRSFSYGLLSLIPNILPIAWTFGIWGHMNGIINLASSGIAMIAIGIVVDDTVHFLVKYMRYKKESGSSVAAITSAIHSVGNAMWSTSVVLFAGFGVLAFSGFQLNSSMGILTAMTIAFALFADMLFLPALLLLKDGDRNEAGIASPITTPDQNEKEVVNG